MRKRRRQLLRPALAGVLAAWAVGAGSGWALGASNGVPTSRAGQGSQTISPYSISGLVYVLNSNAPQNIDRVTFSIAPTNATSVKVKLTGTWRACTNSAGSVSCPTTSPQANINSANGTNLTVVAVQ